MWWVMLAGSALLAALVFVLLALAFVRRNRAARERPRLWIGWLGLGLPAGVLTALFAYALTVGIATLPVADPGAVTIDVTARRYAWDVSYPGAARTTDRLHIPAGRPVDLRLTATDVIHSLWIPRLAGKMDAIPGHVNVLRIVADRPGLYRGECAEYCGTGHKDHGFTVIAHDAAGWAAFLQGGGAR